jgi:tripartite-type tricarboxylate transporter receptor subunit TctC
VVVENRASTMLAGIAVMRASADGYSLLFAGGTLWLTPLMQKDKPFDAAKDFTPISLVSSAPAFLVVASSVPVKTTRELIAHAKANPGQLNYGGSSAGSVTMLSAELFKQMTGTNLVPIFYKGTGGILNALLANEIQISFAPAGSTMPFVKSGKLKALAVTTKRPSALFPGLPTVAESGGLPGYEAGTYYGMFGPLKMPDAVVSRLYQEITQAVNTPATRDKLQAQGVDTIGGTGAELLDAVKSETVRMGKVIKDAGMENLQ